MAIDALHERLEYLVSYSSQLILIGCESLAQQQASLQKFLSVQHENTDIAFLNGEAEFSDIHYRKEIYQQLSKQTGLHNQTLDKGLLGALPQDSGPILICICAAEYISSEILNELWQLVRNNKSQKYARHINVLLFGSPDWITEAKLQLVKDTQHLPVLLSTEKVEPISTTDNLLDTIRQNRRIVTHRMEGSQNDEQDDSIINKPLFKYAIAMVFMLLFSSIIFWQYPEEISGFLDPQSTQTAKADESEEPNLSNRKNNASEQTQAAVIPSEIDTSAPVGEPIQDSLELSEQNEPSAQTEEDQQKLVTNWRQEVEKLETQSEVLNSTVAEPDTSEPINENETESSVTDGVIDASENQLAQPAGLDFEQALLTLPDTSFLLQLSAMADPQAIDNFVVQNGLSNDIWLYTTQRFGGDWHVVVHQQVFDTLEEAREFVNQLPLSVDRSQPFAKSVEQIRQELTVVQE